MTAFSGSGGLIKSNQFGSITLSGVTSNTATLSPTVNVNKSILINLGFDTDQTDIRQTVRLAFTSGTTITATKGLASGITVVNFQVIEFN